MGNELVVGVLAAVLRLKDEMSGTLDRVKQNLSGFGQSVDNAAKSLATAFAAKEVQQAFAGVAKGIGDMVASVSRIADMAGRMGVTAEAFQRLAFAAQQGGADMGAVAGAMRTLSTQLADGKLPRIVTDLGISFEDIKRASPDKTLLATFEAIAKIPDPMAQSAAATALLGRNGATLLPAIRDGFSQVAATAPVMRDATVQAADQIGDKWAEVQARVDAVRLNAMLPLLGVFLQLPSSVQTAIGVFVALTPILTNLGIAIIAAGGPVAAFGMLSTAVTTVAGFFTATLIPAIVAFLPFIAVGGAIVLGVLAVYEAWKNWDKITAFVQGVYTAIKTWLLDKWESIKTTIIGGLNAVATGFLNLKNQAVTYAQQLYTGVKTWIVDKFTDIVQGAKQKIDAVTGFFATMYDKVVGHSYVPDMINAIDQQFNRLPTVMVNPTQSATMQVMNLFDGLFQKMQSKITSVLPGLFGGGDGKGGLFGSLMQMGLGALFGPAGPLAGLVSAGISALGNLAMKGLSAMWNGIKGLFASEESKYVNKPRDEFFAQFGGFEGLASTLTNASNGDTAERLIRTLYDADTRAEYNSAVSAIQQTLSGGATQSVASGLSAAERSVAIGASSDRQTSAGAGTLLGLPGMDGPLMGFASGTGGRYLNFGSGTPVILHGRERVMTEQEQASSGLTVNVTVSAGTVLGNADEFRQCVTKAVLEGIERGHNAMTKFRILTAQAAH